MLASFRRSAVALFLVGMTGGGCSVDSREGDDPPETTSEPALPAPAAPGIQAANAYYYYEDLAGAWAFYTEVMGLETVADYGFAKILRVSPASYLTLVDQAQGMHGPDAPKSATLALVTREVEGWWAYLSGRDVPTLGAYEQDEEAPREGFVVVDPEGYYLEIERYNRHRENQDLLPRLARVEPLGPAGGARPEELTVQATVLRLYYEELEPVQRFWEELLGATLLVDQGWAKVYPVSATGYLGLVDGARGLHPATEDAAVTVSYFTREIDAWHRRAGELGVELRSPAITEGRTRVRTFVGYDPGGYFVEWDTFLPVSDNERLLELLGEW